MIALEDQLLPGQFVDKAKIRLCLLKRHAPAEIPAEHAQVVLLEMFKASAKLFRVIPPDFPENVHRFVASERQMQISDRVQRHMLSYFE